MSTVLALLVFFFRSANQNSEDAQNIRFPLKQDNDDPVIDSKPDQNNTDTSENTEDENSQNEDENSEGEGQNQNGG